MIIFFLCHAACCTSFPIAVLPWIYFGLLLLYSSLICFGTEIFFLFYISFFCGVIVWYTAATTTTTVMACLKDNKKALLLQKLSIKIYPPDSILDSKLMVVPRQPQQYQHDHVIAAIPPTSFDFQTGRTFEKLKTSSQTQVEDSGKSTVRKLIALPIGDLELCKTSPSSSSFSSHSPHQAFYYLI